MCFSFAMVASLSWFLFYLSTQILASSSQPTSPSLEPLSLPSNDAVQISNISYFANATNLAFLPNKFHVPNTRTYLRLGFGFPRRSLDRMKMGTLIAVAGDSVDLIIEEEGRQGLYPPSVTGIQEFVFDIGNGLELRIYNSQLGLYWTFGTLRDVIEGLRLYLIVGERFRRTYFTFE